MALLVHEPFLPVTRYNRRMFFPIRTDRSLRHTPWVNYTLVAVNVMIHMLAIQPASPTWVEALILQPQSPATWHGIPYPYLTYQFLHADWMHLLGNMLFLYVFGNSVEDRLGKLGYLCFYLAGGVLAGLGHALLEPNPVLGASGAVCAVTGAYLALFPLTNVTIVYWFIFIGAFEISSFYLILFQIAQNLFMQLAGSGGVAYMAHLAGYAFGLVIAMLLLWTRILSREPYDLLAVWERRRRRQALASLTRQGYSPWAGSKAGGPVPAQVQSEAPPTPREQEIMAIRSQINAAIAAHDLPAAVQLYRKLWEIDHQQVMGRQEQLDLANQLTSAGDHAQAARAYELFLKFYGRTAEVEQVQLILGLIYTRYLPQPQRARELLEKAKLRLQDPQQSALANQLLAELK